MKVSQFDSHNNKFIEVEITGPSYNQRIVGEGYFIIVSGGKHISFSKGRHDVCFGDITTDIIPDYTVQQYADEYGDKYGDKLTGLGVTVREYLKNYCRYSLI